MSAPAAAVDDCPLSSLPNPDPDRIHDPAAVGRAVAGRLVKVKAGKAVGAVVSVLRTAALGIDRIAADAAGKRFFNTSLLVNYFFQWDSS